MITADPCRVPMRPMKNDAERGIIWFGQSTAKGFPLPSHHPLVFRRALVFAEYHQEQQKIVRIFVTIRGWVEE